MDGLRGGGVIMGGGGVYESSVLHPLGWGWGGVF